MKPYIQLLRFIMKFDTRIQDHIYVYGNLLVYLCNMGGAYWHKKDNAYSPLIVVYLSNAIKDSFSSSLITRL